MGENVKTNLETTCQSSTAISGKEYRRNKVFRFDQEVPTHSSFQLLMQGNRKGPAG